MAADFMVRILPIQCKTPILPKTIADLKDCTTVLRFGIFLPELKDCSEDIYLLPHHLLLQLLEVKPKPIA